MKIGIISDTHDNVENVLKAMALFRREGISLALHCGDVVAPKTVSFFKGVALKMVMGNCDSDLDAFRKNLDAIGGELLGDVGKLEIDHKRILMYHGSDSTKLDKFIKSGDYHYVLTGHTHVTRDERVGLTRVLNPGAHYYGSDGTTMIFDLGKDKVDLVKL